MPTIIRACRNSTYRNLIVVSLTHLVACICVLTFTLPARCAERVVLVGKGFEHGVNSLAFSADSKVLATGCHDDKIRLWDVSTGEKLKEFEMHNSAQSIAFSPDGKRLAATTGNTVVVWDLSNNKKLWTHFDKSPLVAGAIALSPDGKMLAVAEVQAVATLYDLETGKKLDVLEGQNKTIDLAFDKEGKSLATASRYGTMVIWDVAKRKEILTIKAGHEHDIYAMAYSRDKKTLAMASQQHSGGILVEKVLIWDAIKGKKLADYDVKKEIGFVNNRCLAFAPDNKMLAVGVSIFMSGLMPDPGRLPKNSRIPSR